MNDMPISSNAEITAKSLISAVAITRKRPRPNKQQLA